MKHMLKCRKGAQSLTELALLMPFLMILLVGLIEVGFLLQAHVQVSSAAREAARAASLYPATRYDSFNATSENDVKECATNIKGWTLQQTIEQAIVRYPIATTGGSKGCPTTSGTILYSALGRLNSTKATSGTVPPCPTGNGTGWLVGVVTSPTYTPTADSGTANPAPGAQGTVTLCYPYRLILASDLFRYWGSPIWISKSVVFTFQQ